MTSILLREKHSMGTWLSKTEEQGQVVETEQNSEMSAGPNLPVNPIKTGAPMVPVSVNVPGFSDKFAVVIPGVLSPDECKEWIRMTEEQGYEQALVNVGNGNQKLMLDYRKSLRCIIDSQEMADTVYNRISKFLPKRAFDKRIVGPNERLRFLKYSPGDYFAPHFDGAYHCPNTGRTSRLTMMVYLNDGAKGGSTRFFGNDGYQADVVPAPGTVLVFEHRMYHQGTGLDSGVKYCVRTDIMYEYIDDESRACVESAAKQHSV